MHCCTGRPQDCNGRDAAEIRVYDLLDRLQVPFVRIDHEAIFTMEGIREIETLLDAPVCKNLFLCNRQQTRFYLVMLPGNKNLQTRVLADQLGIPRPTFADEAHMKAFLDLYPGSVSVLGLMNDTENRVQLIVDRAVLQSPRLACHPCRNTSSISLPMTDFLQKILPAIHHDAILVDL